MKNLPKPEYRIWKKGSERRDTARTPALFGSRAGGAGWPNGPVGVPAITTVDSRRVRGKLAPIIFVVPTSI
jgi:hypothetical protein